jgi:hypothetical protein
MKCHRKSRNAASLKLAEMGITIDSLTEEEKISLTLVHRHLSGAVIS